MKQLALDRPRDELSVRYRNEALAEQSAEFWRERDVKVEIEKRDGRYVVVEAE